MKVSAVRPGRRIEWCGRCATVVRVDRIPNQRRRHRQYEDGYHLYVEVEGQPHRLHYWANEEVRVIATGEVAGQGADGCQPPSHNTWTYDRPAALEPSSVAR